MLSTLRTHRSEKSTNRSTTSESPFTVLTTTLSSPENTLITLTSEDKVIDYSSTPRRTSPRSKLSESSSSTTRRIFTSTSESTPVASNSTKTFSSQFSPSKSHTIQTETVSKFDTTTNSLLSKLETTYSTSMNTSTSPSLVTLVTSLESRPTSDKTTTARPTNASSVGLTTLSLLLTSSSQKTEKTNSSSSKPATDTTSLITQDRKTQTRTNLISTSDGSETASSTSFTISSVRTREPPTSVPSISTTGRSTTERQLSTTQKHKPTGRSTNERQLSTTQNHNTTDCLTRHTEPSTSSVSEITTEASSFQSTQPLSTTDILTFSPVSTQTSQTTRLTSRSSLSSTSKPASRCPPITLWTGVEFVGDPDDCTVYYLCVRSSNDKVDAIRLVCNFGMFWDNSGLICKPARSVICPADPCRDARRFSYPHGTSCSATWLCSGGRTYDSVCCNRGSAFNPLTSRCIPAPPCMDGCPAFMRYDRCSRWAVVNKPNKFFERVPWYGIVERDCAFGAEFEQHTCECSQYARMRPSTTTDKPVCKASVYLPFDSDFGDKSDSPKTIENHGVTTADVVASVGGGAAYFDGASRLVIEQFRNFSFGSTFLVRFRFWELPDRFRARNLEGLLTNGDCDTAGSFGVGFHRRNTSIVTHLDTTEKKNSKLSLGAIGSWKNVEYRLHGSRLTLSVGENQQIIQVTGLVLSVDKALQLGFGCMPHYSYFYGYIDELYIYTCIPD